MPVLELAPASLSSAGSSSLHTHFQYLFQLQPHLFVQFRCAKRPPESLGDCVAARYAGLHVGNSTLAEPDCQAIEQPPPDAPDFAMRVHREFGDVAVLLRNESREVGNHRPDDITQDMARLDLALRDENRHV